jgi:hypothetical protein
MSDGRAHDWTHLRVFAAIIGSMAACTWSHSGLCQRKSGDSPEPLSPTSAIRTSNVGNLPLGSGAVQTLYAPNSATTPRRQLSIILTGDMFFDSNAIRTNDLRNNTRYSKEDLLIPMGAVMDLVLPSGKNVFSLQGSIRYDIYSRNSDLSSENVNLKGGYRRTFNPCSVDLDGSLIRSLTDFADTVELTFQKNIQTVGLLAGSLTCGSEAGLRPFSTINYTTARNSQAPRRTSDYDNLVIGGGIALVAGSAGTLGLISSSSRNIYPGRSSEEGLGPRDVRVRSIGVYFQRSSAQILQTSVQLNYTAVGRGPSTPPFHGISGAVLVRYQPGGRLALGALVSRAVQTAFTNSASYVIETDYSVTASVPINQKFRVALFYLQQNRSYQGNITEDHELSSDARQSGGVDASYKISRIISVNLSLIYQQRVANDPLFNYSGVKGGVGAGIRL